MRMTVLSQGEGVVYVDLSKLEHEDIIDDRPVSVTDALLFLELAVFTGPGTVISKQPGFSKGFIKPSLHELPRATLCAAISHVNSPHSFYVQRVSFYCYHTTLLGCRGIVSPMVSGWAGGGKKFGWAVSQKL